MPHPVTMICAALYIRLALHEFALIRIHAGSVVLHVLLVLRVIARLAYAAVTVFPGLVPMEFSQCLRSIAESALLFSGCGYR